MKKIMFLLCFLASINGEDLGSILLKHKNYVLKGDIPKSVYIESEISAYGLKGKSKSWYIYPDKYYIEMDLGIMSQTEIFDGERAFSIDRNNKLEEKRGKKDINKSYLSAIMSSFAYLDYKKYDLKLKDYGKTTIENIECYKVGYRYKNSKEIKHCYNIETGKLEFVLSREMGINVSEKREDYTRYSSVMIPKISNVTLALGMGTMKTVNSEVEINKTIPKDLFSIGKSSKDFYFLGNKNSSKSKIKIENGHIFLKAKINNSGYRYFIYDTGAMTTVLSKDLAEKLKLKIDGKLPSLGAGGQSTTSLTKIDSLRIGSLKFNSQSLAVMDFSSLQPYLPMKINGLIGYDVASRIVSEIDYSNSEIIFHDPEKFQKPEGFREIKLELYNKLILVPAIVNGVEGKFYLDTGSNSGVDISSSFAKRAKIDLSNSKSSSIMGVGGAKTMKIKEGVELLFGDKKCITNVGVHSEKDGVFAMEEVDGIIGSKLFGSEKIITDYMNRVIYLK
ncbi:MAG: hypothetical protein CR982_01645 [Candidatus Cloacimonadota bacterium]|nr:MAG: hypothetical protein CR982_01645 [Candidatus Cloacimonadota bacterium]PIE82084.1 MAG: hypothetical protein CSA15_00080 [Candidatus Delongbacteria bacterium]